MGKQQVKSKPWIRKESDILSSCLKLLKARGIFALRMNVGAMRHGSRYVRFGIKGCADILAIRLIWEGGRPNGKTVCLFDVIWIECKRTGGKPSHAQKEFAKVVTAEGHRYVVVHSAEELNQIL